MSIINNIKGWIQKMFGWTNKAEEEFGIKLSKNSITKDFTQHCINIYMGKPDWLEPGIKTINMAKTVSEEIARLTTMNIDVTVTEGARADYLQGQMDSIKNEFRQWVEYACAAGEVIIKPNGRSIDVLFPSQYVITEEVGKDITGIVFLDEYYDAKDAKYYTRLEYHRFEDNKYLISNRCFVGKKPKSFDERVSIEDTVWAGIDEETVAEGVDKMLFGLMRIRGGNNVDLGSHAGLPVFAGALGELEDLDIAYSRFAKENYDSKRTVLLDSDRLMASGTNLKKIDRTGMVKNAGLPDYVKVVEAGTDGKEVYHEINPTLNTETRLKGMNSLLSQIGFKCGFSNGYFVFNEKTGMVTATQVESDDRRTLQLISDMRDALTDCIDELLYALDKFADAYKLAPRGKYTVAYDMQDLTQNHAEDTARWFSYVQQGYIPFWYYLVHFEGFSEDEAKAIAQSQNKEELVE